MVDTSFPQFWFSHECWNCIISHKCYQCFHCCDRPTSFIFDIVFAKYANLNKDSLLNKNVFPWKKQLIQRVSLRVHECCYSWQPWYFGMPRHLRILPISAHRLLKRYIFGYPDSVIYYFTSSRIDFDEADCLLRGHDGKENKATTAVGCHRASGFPRYCFSTMSAKCRHGEEGNEWVSLVMKVILISWTFWKGPGIPKVCGPYFEKRH